MAQTKTQVRVNARGAAGAIETNRGVEPTVGQAAGTAVQQVEERRDPAGGGRGGAPLTDAGVGDAETVEMLAQRRAGSAPVARNDSDPLGRGSPGLESPPDPHGNLAQLGRGTGGVERHDFGSRPGSFEPLDGGDPLEADSQAIEEADPRVGLLGARGICRLVEEDAGVPIANQCFEEFGALPRRLGKAVDQHSTSRQDPLRLDAEQLPRLLQLERTVPHPGGLQSPVYLGRGLGQGDGAQALALGARRLADGVADRVETVRLEARVQQVAHDTGHRSVAVDQIVEFVTQELVLARDLTNQHRIEDFRRSRLDPAPIQDLEHQRVQRLHLEADHGPSTATHDGAGQLLPQAAGRHDHPDGVRQELGVHLTGAKPLDDLVQQAFLERTRSPGHDHSRILESRRQRPYLPLPRASLPARWLPRDPGSHAPGTEPVIPPRGTKLRGLAFDNEIDNDFHFRHSDPVPRRPA